MNLAERLEREQVDISLRDAIKAIHGIAKKLGESDMDSMEMERWAERCTGAEFEYTDPAAPLGALAQEFDKQEEVRL